MWWRLETMETIAGKEQGKKKGQPGILRVLEERSWVRKKWLSTSNVNIDNWYRIINVEMAQQLRRQMRKAETGEHTIKALTKETEEMWEKLRMGKKLSFKKNLKCSQVIFYFENPKTKRQPNETLFNDYKVKSVLSREHFQNELTFWQHPDAHPNCVRRGGGGGGGTGEIISCLTTHNGEGRQRKTGHLTSDKL